MAYCELLNINKRFEDKHILKNFSLEINQGELICISGQSGAGKSTLIHILGLLEKADTGVINVCGQDNLKPNSRQAKKLLRHNIGFLFQNFALIDDKSVSYNLNIGFVKKGRLDKKKKLELLKELELDVTLDDKVFQLSGGEQQRLAIARLLVKDCDLILADEPTGSLDEANRAKVLDILMRLNQAGKTIIIVSHDPYVMNRCSRVIHLSR
ncbi:putative ABC transport system ATP-binding protein [Natronobacillus azotifigens]|uniref:ATP-binding cassette domain-containing protein n=1 Tax=Natronobacillus azotifigens TaxID=472978 RepID=A0A9J6RGP1_9BACI|nr:ATP-binding cassette domain-containing protein [Natronobacillus azotifigens]MCZ0704572.1 ATP-binding cassette domain-containing protein [Natronobacillus azotifigens]